MEPVRLADEVLEPRAGRLLVSTPILQDPNFARTIVLLLDVDEGGVLGVVLNRPTEVPVGQVLAPWNALVGNPDVLFEGGPVGTDSALAVGCLAADPERDGVVGFRHVVGRLGLIDLDTPPELVEGSLVSLRIFAGYAGWSPGQLQEEIGEGAWVVLPGEPYDVFADLPGMLWAQVLRRQPEPMSWLSTMPADPMLN